MCMNFLKFCLAALKNSMKMLCTFLIVNMSLNGFVGVELYVLQQKSLEFLFALRTCILIVEV